MHTEHVGSRQRPKEDWFDEGYVAYWIGREEQRRALRTRHFGLLRALLPFSPDAAFRYLNVGAGPGAFDELVLSSFSAAQATLVDSSPVMLRPLAAWARADLAGGFIGGAGGGSFPGTAEEQVIWLREAGFAPVDCFFKDLSIALVGGCKGNVAIPQRGQG